MSDQTAEWRRLADDGLEPFDLRRALRAACDQIEAFETERPRFCNLCHAVATGRAWIEGDRYCHGDDDLSPTCYERAQMKPQWTDIGCLLDEEPNRAHPETWSDDT